MKKKQNIAFVSTEYQQNILFAICLQENVTINILFIRKGIKVNNLADKFAKRIIFYEDIPYRIQNVFKFKKEFLKIIKPNLNTKINNLFIWGIGHPLIKIILNNHSIHRINLIEEGTGSYIKWGKFNSNLGIKESIFSLILNPLLIIITKRRFFLKPKKYTGYSLYDQCFPDLKNNNIIIKKEFFEKILNYNHPKKILKLNENSVMFINSPYVEFGLLKESEYELLLEKVFNKIVEDYNFEISKLYWKVHPRTNIPNEKKRLSKFVKKYKFPIEIIDAKINIENIIIYNFDKSLKIYSLGSSALYVIKYLSYKKMEVVLLNNNILTSKIQKQLIDFYKRINIKII